MRLSAILSILSVFAVALALSVGVAVMAVERIEKISATGVGAILARNDITWTELEADGLLVRLHGTAPSEAMRFRAISLAGEVVDAHRVIDNVAVADRANIAPPRFRVEILRNDTGVSLIGLISTHSDRDQVVDDIRDIRDAGQVTDMLEEADYPEPDGWEEALDFALFALERLPRSKISVGADQIVITAITDSRQQRANLEQALTRRAPNGADLVLDLSAPRPVISPFTLRFLIEDGVARFDACSAGTEATRGRILRVARQVGLDGQADCTIGLGQPSPHWGQAVEAGITAIAKLGAGSITYSDVDITLIAPETVDPQEFDRDVGELEAALPDVFALHAVLQKPEVVEEGDASEALPELTALLSPEGLVQVRGRLTDERERTVVESLARAHWGVDEVYVATRLDADLPDGWSVRVLAALDALALLKNGQAYVTPKIVSIRGVTNDEFARAEISRILSDRLGAAQNFAVAVDYVAPFAPEDFLPSPQECVTALNSALEETKITFGPGETDLPADAADVVDRLAEIMKDCEHVDMEIGGHTDSQGREQMNQNLSQTRADSVLNALMARRVLTRNITAKGYGESQPIADNGTQEGREANRRITFTLISDLQEDAATDPTPEGSSDGSVPEDENAVSENDAAAETPSDETPPAEDEATE